MVISFRGGLKRYRTMRRAKASLNCRRGGPGAVIVAFLCVAFGLPAIGLAAPPPISDAATLAYIRREIRADAFHPGQALSVRFAAPYLFLTWQQKPPGQPTSTAVPAQAIRIDMRYAQFDLWHRGNGDLNTIIVDCAQEYLCYAVMGTPETYYHGDIDYSLYTYTGRRIVQALNHLALTYANKRERNPFGMKPAVITPDGSEPPALEAPIAGPR